jgi:CBS-domain-containing membrane protein
MRRKVKDVMTTEVVCASRETPYKELVRLLLDHGVSALPVVDGRHHVVGLVSEADLLLKEELSPQLDEGPMLMSKRRRIERAKAQGLTAADVMTSPVVTVNELAAVAEAARLLHARGVKRLPVQNAVGRLVGIVSRSDLLKVFLRTDEAIRREILEKVRPHDHAGASVPFQIEVHNGVVTLRGTIHRRSLALLLVRAVYGVDGVVAVEDWLDCNLDDTIPAPIYP